MKNLFLVFLLFSTHIAKGQTGMMKGKVYVSGSEIQLDSVLVKMVGTDTTLVFVTESNLDGYYELSDLPPSEYVIEYSRKGFDTVRAAGINIQPQRITFMDAGLKRSSTERERKRKKVKRN